MKVLAVIDSLDQGGAERSLVDTLVAMGPAVERAIAVFRSSADGFESEARAAGIVVHRVEGGLARRVRGLRRLERALQPDVVHSSLWNADLASRLALLGRRTPLVCSLVNDTYADARLAGYRPRRRALVEVLRAVDRITGRRVDRFHAVTESVRDHHVAALGLDPSAIDVRWRGRDTARYRPSTPAEREATRRALGVDGPLVVAIGRLEPQKDLVTLVDAVALLRTHEPDLTCVIAGRDGNDGDRIRARIRDRGVETSVRLLGHRADVASILGAADCFVLTSRYEGTAGAVIEAMLCGTPVVCSDLPGTREVSVDGSLARLVPPGDVSGFALAIRSTLAGSDDATLERVRASVASRFTIDAAAAGMLELYGRVGRSGAAAGQLHVVTDTDRRGAQVFGSLLAQRLGGGGTATTVVALRAGSVGGLDVEVLAPSGSVVDSVRRLRRVMRGASITVAHGARTLPACALAGLGPGRRFVYRQISDPQHWAPSRAKRLRVRAAYHRAHHVVALSDRTARVLETTFGVPPGKITVIPNAVPEHHRPAAPTERLAARRRFAVGEGQVVFGFAGALVEEKGVLDLLAALPAAAHLLVAGDGPLRGEVARHPGASALGSLDDLADFYAALDVFVLPSWTEQQPAVVLEAGQSGLPVVATTVGDLPSMVIDGETGSLVPPRDRAALRAALAALAADPDGRARMGAAAVDHIAAGYAVDDVVRRWAALLASLG